MKKLEGFSELFAKFIQMMACALTESVSGELITQTDKYSGVRLFIEASFDTIRQRIQIDVGFGDVIIPFVQKLEFPVLLNDFQIPVIRAYSKETVIAEKFQAMIELSVVNSRMKDFYDVYLLLKGNVFDSTVLQEAIVATFKNRDTVYTENHALFSLNFVSNVVRRRNWTAFLNKINRDKSLSFEEVMSTITEKLEPHWEMMK